MPEKLTQEEFLKRVANLNNGITAIDKYVNISTKIQFRCGKGHVWSASPRNIINNHSGCPYCANKKVLVGYNDLWTTRPDVARLLKNPRDGYKYTKNSQKRSNFVCPDCGAINNKVIDLVSRYGFVCQECSDGISYPNKFGRAFLDQLPIENHECEFSPSWADGRLYDNYFEYDGNRYILEMDGSFHYEETTTTEMTLEERQKIDIIKDELARDHGVKVVRIDCRKSNCDYIKNNILSSELSTIFNLSNINWDLCDKKAQKNLIKEVCKLYESGIHDLHIIKNKLHISIWAVRKYVQDGARFGWCSYTKTESMRINSEKRMTPVCIIDDNGKILYKFKGMTTCVSTMKELYGINLNTPNIVKSCQTHKPYKGFNFRYLKDFKEKQIRHLINTSPLDCSDEDFYF